MYIDFEMLQNEKSPLDNFSLQKMIDIAYSNSGLFFQRESLAANFTAQSRLK